MQRIITVWGMAAILTGPALGATYVVNPDGTGDFPTIQAAVNAAVNGDVIELGDGTFTGAGNRDVSYLGKAITIGSQGGTEACIINCAGGGLHRAFLFVSGEGSNSTLEGVTITGGDAGEGAGLYCEDSSPTISNTTFVGNIAGGFGAGGAMVAIGPMLPRVTDCAFYGNRASFGGAIQACYGTMELTRCTFANNSGDRGGALYI
jgi:hypothetical protein